MMLSRSEDCRLIYDKISDYRRLPQTKPVKPEKWSFYGFGLIPPKSGSKKNRSGEAAIASGTADTRFRMSKKPVQEDRLPSQEHEKGNNFSLLMT
jgi:hypothetical protein